MKANKKEYAIKEISKAVILSRDIIGSISNERKLLAIIRDK